MREVKKVKVPIYRIYILTDLEESAPNYNHFVFETSGLPLEALKLLVDAWNLYLWDFPYGGYAFPVKKVSLQEESPAIWKDVDRTVPRSVE